MTKILHVLPDLNPGGAERLVAQLAVCMQSVADVSIVSLYDSNGSDIEQYLASHGVKVIFLGKKVGFDYRIILKLKRILDNARPDILHTHLYINGYTLLPAWTCGPPIMVHTIHSTALKEMNPFLRMLQKISYSFGVNPVAISQALLPELKSTYRLDNVPVIPNGIDIKTYSSQNKDRVLIRNTIGLNESDTVFICVANLTEPKNHGLLFKAFSLVTNDYKDVQLLIVGDGKLRADLEEQVNSLQIGNQVKFLGMRNDIPDLLHASDAFVLASNYEGNPLSLLEAMVSGKPVICTRVGGIPDLVNDSVEGFLVDKNNASALASAMKRLIVDPELRLSMAHRATTRAINQYDIRITANEYIKLYNRLMSAKGITSLLEYVS